MAIQSGSERGSEWLQLDLHMNRPGSRGHFFKLE